MRKPRSLSEDWKLIGSIGENGEAHEVFELSVRRQKIDGDWIDVVVDARGERRKKVRYHLAYSIQEWRFAQNRDWKIMLEHDLETARLLEHAMGNDWRKEIMTWWRSK